MNRYFGIFKELKELGLPVGDMDLYEGYFAKIYDEITSVSLSDLGHFLPHVEEMGGPVLELGCGTGRLLIEIAQRGYKITGLDISDSMLNILREKMTNTSMTTQENIRLYKEDMTNFTLNDRFRTCILGATSICLLPNDESILNMFQTVYNHLEPGGRFIFDYSISTESPEKPIEIDPIHTFTQSNDSGKQFVLIGEKRDYIKKVSTVNFYAETIDKQHNTFRNFGNTQKRLLTDRMISSLIKDSSFNLIDSSVQKVDNYKVRCVVLEKTPEKGVQ